MAIKHQQSGMSLVGLLIAMAIIITGVVYVFGSMNFALGTLSDKKQLYQANFLAVQKMEAVRNIRDVGEWDTGLGVVTIDTAYHLEQSGTPLTWNLVLGEQTVGHFTESVIFNQVFRDANDNITASGGVLDVNTKKITVTISWPSGSETKNVELVGILTNW